MLSIRLGVFSKFVISFLLVLSSAIQAAPVTFQFVLPDWNASQISDLIGTHATATITLDNFSSSLIDQIYENGDILMITIDTNGTYSNTWEACDIVAATPSLEINYISTNSLGIPFLDLRDDTDTSHVKFENAGGLFQLGRFTESGSGWTPIALNTLPGFGGDGGSSFPRDTLIEGITVETMLNERLFPYNFTVSNQAYADLLGTTLLSTETWDDPSYVVPVGFDFEYFGVTSNTLSFVGVGAAFIFEGGLDSTVDAFLAYGSDLIDRGYNDDQVLSPISYKLEGNLGSQILKLEWKNAGFYKELSNTGLSTNFINFQVWFYEGSNNIEIHFGPNNITLDAEAHYVFDGRPFIGLIEGLNINSSCLETYWYLSGDESGPSVEFITGFNIIPTDSVLADDPADGTVYRFEFDELVPDLYSGQLYELADTNGDGVAEIGILRVERLESKVRLEILNGKDRTTLDEVVWVDNFSDSSLSLHIIPDMNNNGVDEVGLFGIQNVQNNEGKPQMFVRDLKTGNKVGDVYNWVANWTEVSALVLDDMTGDGLSEIAIQGRFEEGNRPQLVVKIGNTNTILDTYSYPDLFISPQYFQHSDTTGDGIAEIATIGRLSSNNKIQVKIASGTDAADKMKAYNFPDKWDDISWHRLDDSNGDGQDDWGLFGTLREDGRPQLITKNGADPKGALKIHAWPAEMQNSQFYRIPDMNNDGVDEVAAAGRRSNNDRYQFQVQDGTDRNVLLANHNLNLDLENVSYHVLPDLSGDEQVEIGFMGINTQGEYELVIRHGDTANGQYATHNLGSDWKSAPAITSLGDTDDDGLADLLIYGQNATGGQLVITSL